MDDQRVVGVAPDISELTFIGALKATGSPALSAGHAVYQYCVKRGVSPSFVLVMFNRESGMGKAGTATITHSWGNTRLPTHGGVTPVRMTTAGEARSGQFPVFKDWIDGGIATVARFVDYAPYAGKTTVKEIIPTWAPNSDGNDSAAYVRGVLAQMAAWRSQEAASAAKGGTMQQFAETIKELTPGSNRPGDRIGAFHAFVVHETDNENPGAGAENTYQYLMGTYNGNVRPQASFHFVTDGIGAGHSYQLLPSGPNDAEACWAIGDGQDAPTDESNHTVSGEICVNRDGNYSLACQKMAAIVARVLKAHGKPVVKDVTVRQHGSYWSAANPAVHQGCPKHLKAGDWGWTWDRFVGAVQAEYNKLGGNTVDQSQKIAGAVTPAHPDGYMTPGQADTFTWPDGEGVITYRKVRYYNPEKRLWFEREWDANGGFTPWQQVA